MGRCLLNAKLMCFTYGLVALSLWLLSFSAKIDDEEESLFVVLV